MRGRPVNTAHTPLCGLRQQVWGRRQRFSRRWLTAGFCVKWLRFSSNEEQETASTLQLLVRTRTTEFPLGGRTDRGVLSWRSFILRLFQQWGRRSGPLTLVCADFELWLKRSEPLRKKEMSHAGLRTARCESSRGSTSTSVTFLPALQRSKRLESCSLNANRDNNINVISADCWLLREPLHRCCSSQCLLSDWFKLGLLCCWAREWGGCKLVCVCVCAVVGCLGGLGGQCNVQSQTRWITDLPAPP